MKNTAIVFFALSLLLIGCNSERPNNYLVFKKNGFEIFRSEPIRTVSIVDDRIIVRLSQKDREILTKGVEIFNDPVLLDVYFGENNYTDARLDFNSFNFIDEKTMSLPVVSDKLHMIEDVGIRVRQ